MGAAVFGGVPLDQVEDEARRLEYEGEDLEKFMMLIEALDSEYCKHMNGKQNKSRKNPVAGKGDKGRATVGRSES